MIFFITGAAGFIGSSLAESLLKKGNSVVSLDNFNDFYDPAIKRGNIQRLEKYEGFQSIEGDIRDKAVLDDIFNNNSFDCVVHLAAMAGVRPSIDDPRLYYDVNINGTYNILEKCSEQKPKKVILASSSSVYGNNKEVPFKETDNVDHPISPYAATKKMNEIMAYNFYHLHQIPICCCRFFTVYGPHQRPEMAIHKFTQMIDNNQAIPVYNFGECERDYTYIDDIVHGLEQIVSTHFEYDVVNLGESATISTNDLIALIEASLDKVAQKNMMPAQVGDVDKTYADISHAKDIYNYQPKTAIKTGIESFVKWYKNQLIKTEQ
jgi:UDP-glucuronate 4-epimerase